MRALLLVAKLQVVTCLVVAGASGAGASEPKRPTLATLLARHAPILVLHPAERFQPVPVEGFLADSDLQRQTAGSWETVSGPLPAGGADLRLDQRSCSARDGIGAAPCYATAEAAHGAAPVAYGAAHRTKTRLALQYWLWYPFNDYGLAPTSDVWQVHEGDWESVNVILDLAGRPLTVGLSKHCDGTRRAWAAAPRRGTRPVAYVALGSHASYFGRGTFRHSPLCWPRELRDIVRALNLVDHSGSGRTIRPKLVPITAGRPLWMRFAGVWGEDGYLHFPNNDPVVYAGSPRGPAYREQWRTPVQDVLSWPRG